MFKVKLFFSGIPKIFREVNFLLGLLSLNLDNMFLLKQMGNNCKDYTKEPFNNLVKQLPKRAVGT